MDAKTENKPQWREVEREAAKPPPPSRFRYRVPLSGSDVRTMEIMRGENGIGIHIQDTRPGYADSSWNCMPLTEEQAIQVHRDLSALLYGETETE